MIDGNIKKENKGKTDINYELLYEDLFEDYVILWNTYIKATEIYRYGNKN